MAIRERRLFTTDEYEAMWNAGVFTTGDRIELLDGEILRKPVVNPRHARCTNRFTRLFSASLADRAIVSIQNAIRLPPRSEPEPDVALLQLPDERYGARHPEPDDIYLIVEIADSSLRQDRMVKLARYAASGVRETWIVDLETGRIETHTQPATSGYALTRVFGPGDQIAPSAFPDVLFEVSDLVP